MHQCFNCQHTTDGVCSANIKHMLARWDMLRHGYKSALVMEDDASFSMAGVDHARSTLPFGPTAGVASFDVAMKKVPALGCALGCATHDPTKKARRILDYCPADQG